VSIKNKIMNYFFTIEKIFSTKNNGFVSFLRVKHVSVH
jgi:hypothetical protein